MKELAIIEVNKLLELIGGSRLSDSELVILTKKKIDPVSLCEYYSTTGEILEIRSNYNPDAKKELTALISLAKDDGCTIKGVKIHTPRVDVPFYSGCL